MNLFFYILSKTNLYSDLKGLKDSKVFKFKGLRSFRRDLSSHSCQSRNSCSKKYFRIINGNSCSFSARFNRAIRVIREDLIEPFVSFEKLFAILYLIQRCSSPLRGSCSKKNFWIINGNSCSFSARFNRAIRVIREIRVQSCCSFNIFAILAVL